MRAAAVGVLASCLASAVVPACGSPGPALADSLLLDAPIVVFDGGLTDTVFVEAVRETPGAAPVGPALVTVVPLEEARGGADLAELLAAAAGLRVRRYGGAGAQSVPSIRGSSGGRVALLVDGVPLADAQDGTVDLATLPLERFATAEVYRGPAPARYGGGGGAGAINLISRAPGEAGVSARLFGGSFGDRGGRLSAGWRSRDGGRAALALVHGRRIDNTFPFLDHNQTFANPDDDTTRVRTNAGFAEWGGYLAGRWDGARLRAAASAGAFRREGGRPGPLGYESPHAGVRQERQDGRFSLEDAGGLRLEVAATHAVELLHDDAQEVGWDPPGTVRGEDRDLSGRVTATRAGELERLPGPWPAGRVQLTAGADWRRQWYREALGDDRDPLRARTTVTTFASLRLDLYGPRLTLLPAWRWQRLTDNFPPLPALPWLPEVPLAEPHTQDAVSPSIGAVWEALPSRLFVEARAARYLRPPTWIELFGHRGGIDGNRDLLPERVTSRDVGVRWRARGGWWTRLVAFTAITDRAVVFVQNSQRTSRAINLGLARVDGLEWEVGGGTPTGPRWSANLTWQDARDRGVDPAYRDKRLPFQPALDVAVSATVPCGPWEVGLALAHESESERDRYNSAVERAPARTLWNLSLAHTWRRAAGATFTATAEVINLTDNVVYDVEGFPLPGRVFRLSLLAR